MRECSPMRTVGCAAVVGLVIGLGSVTASAGTERSDGTRSFTGGSPPPIEALNRAKLTAPDGAPGDQFGVSVALDGDTVVVGANADDTPAGESFGSTYVFVRSGTTWTEQAKLTASDGEAGDYFGGAVALDRETAVVTSEESAYVFVRTGTTWTQQAKLLASDGDAGDIFGASVAIDGDTAVVGAELDSDVEIRAGAAYVFVRSGTVWTQQAKLTSNDLAYEDHFGVSVDVEGDVAVVGAFWDNTPAGPNDGSAYVFVRSGTTWTQRAQLTASDGAPDDNFGVSLGLSGDTLVAGALFGDTPTVADAGAAYVFVRSGTTWMQQAKLTAPDGAQDDYFGSSVAASGDVAIVGAYGDDAAAETNAGSAYAYTRSGTAWTARAKLTAPDGLSRDRFGSSVAADGTTAAVGAYGDDTPAGADAGSAWVYWR